MTHKRSLFPEGTTAIFETNIFPRAFRRYAHLVDLNEPFVLRGLKRDNRKSCTLIIEPILIESHKREAQMSYLGFKGYRPVVATLKEIGLVIAYEFKEGNDNGGRVEILKRAFSKMPKGKKIEEVLCLFLGGNSPLTDNPISPILPPSKSDSPITSSLITFSAVPVESKTLAELIPGAQLVMIDGSGHFPLLETSEAFNKALEEFLATHSRLSGVKVT